MKLNKNIHILLVILLFSCFSAKENDSISNQNIETKNFVSHDSVYSISEVNKLPKYNGREIESLLYFFSKEFNMPMQESLQTKIILEFVVDTFGIINNIHIYNKQVKDYTLMDVEGIRVLKLTSSKWECGYLNDKKVIVKMILPIHIDNR